MGEKCKMVKKFLRRTWNRYVKLGKGRKKKQVWRSPKGRDNKMREKKRGYPATVSIGYGTVEKEKPVLVKNLNNLAKVKNNENIIISRVGKKKKIELIKKAIDMKIKIQNINVEKFLKETSKGEKK